MSILLLIKKVALEGNDSYLKSSIKKIENYMDKHGVAVTTEVADDYINVYGTDNTFLLRIRTGMLN